MKVDQGRTIVDMFHMKEPGRERLGPDRRRADRPSTASTAAATGPSACGSRTRSTSGSGSTRVRGPGHPGVGDRVPRRHGAVRRRRHHPRDGTLSKRFVDIEHDIDFDGDRKRPAGRHSCSPTRTARPTGWPPTTHQAVNAYYGQPLPKSPITRISETASTWSTSAGTAPITTSSSPSRARRDVGRPAHAV